MKVISEKNLPARLSWIPFAVWFLILERFKAPGWLYGVLGTFLVLAWIIEVIKSAKQTKVDVFRSEP